MPVKSGKERPLLTLPPLRTGQASFSHIWLKHVFIGQSGFKCPSCQSLKWLNYRSHRKSYNWEEKKMKHIAIIPGDGIGVEVTREAVKVLMV
jgi:hypothetical protein